MPAIYISFTFRIILEFYLIINTRITTERIGGNPEKQRENEQKNCQKTSGDNHNEYSTNGLRLQQQQQQQHQQCGST